MAEGGRAPGRARGYAGTWPERGAIRADGFVPSGLGIGASSIARLREWPAAGAGAGRLLPWGPVAFSVGIALYFTADHEPVGWITVVAAVVLSVTAFLLRRPKIFSVAGMVLA